MSTNIAIINESSISRPELDRVVCGLNVQSQEHLVNAWGDGGRVAVFDSAASIPADCCTVHLVETLNDPQMSGYHYFDQLGRMFAYVEVRGKMIMPGVRMPWQIVLSHEVLELIVDPYGRRMVRAPSIVHAGEMVDYIVEVCDPCQHPAYGWVLDTYGTMVSDFYSRAYFMSGPVTGRYSYYNNIQRPLQILPGGYLCWQRPDGTMWRAESTGQNSKVSLQQLYNFELTPGVSRRERVDFFTHKLANSTAGKRRAREVNARLSARMKKLLHKLGETRKRLQAAAEKRHNKHVREWQIRLNKKKQFKASYSKPVTVPLLRSL